LYIILLTKYALKLWLINCFSIHCITDNKLLTLHLRVNQMKPIWELFLETGLEDC
jgi:hypothetical protein